jgi:nicotinamide riboside kinase
MTNPYGVRAVFTGPPCTGKTTLINRIAAKTGHTVIHEANRSTTDSNTSEESDETIEHNIAEKRYEDMKHNDSLKHQVYLFDRSLYDSIAYSKVFCMKALPSVIYKTKEFVEKPYFDLVFFVNTDIAYEKNGIRDNHENLKKSIGSAIEKAYTDHGYFLIHISEPTDKTVTDIIETIKSVIDLKDKQLTDTIMSY